MPDNQYNTGHDRPMVDIPDGLLCAGSEQANIDKNGNLGKPSSDSDD